MRYPVDDFKTQWNMTAGYGFGVKTSYGYHEAIDINDNNGGDSDLGKPLYAIADGEVTSVHEHTTSPTFGKHIHIKIVGSWGERFIHYAHCQDIFVQVGDKVTEGQKIATLGKSGTVYAHCHFACKKQPTGIDAIAKTLDELQMWEDPIKFIESNIKTTILSEPNPGYLPTFEGQDVTKDGVHYKAYKNSQGVLLWKIEQTPAVSQPTTPEVPPTPPSPLPPPEVAKDYKSYLVQVKEAIYGKNWFWVKLAKIKEILAESGV